MPKRTFWLFTGAVAGAGSSIWIERRVRRTVKEAAARLQPDTLVLEVGRSAARVAEATGDRVRDAVAEGRSEMRRHEERLWAELAERGMAIDTMSSLATGAPSSPATGAPSSLATDTLSSLATGGPGATLMDTTSGTTSGTTSPAEVGSSVRPKGRRSTRRRRSPSQLDR